MPLRIAVPSASCRTPLFNGHSRVLAGAAVNDNGRSCLQEPALRAALRHFADHGLGAADEAGKRAQAASSFGEHEAAQHWRNICLILGGQIGPDTDPDPTGNA